MIKISASKIENQINIDIPNYTEKLS